MRFRALAAVAGLLALMVSPVRASAAPQAPALTMDQAVRAYAPRIHIHKKEKFLPMSADTFINGSELRWHHDSLCDDDSITKRPEARRLSGKVPLAPYTHQTKSSNKLGFGCKHGGDPIPSSGNVRPRDDNDADREGFFLDLDNFLRPGFGPGPKGDIEAPVYFSTHGDAIAYWFLYGFNEAYSAKSAPIPTHEGDWENITVLLDRNHRATEVVYAGHGKQCVIKAGQGRPEVYSARGVHASYPKPGSYPHDGVIDQAGRKGPIWNAAAHLVPLQAQDWYGYGGGWGEVGNEHPFVEPGMTTGPQGPHPVHKTGLPKGPLGPCKG